MVHVVRSFTPKKARVNETTRGNLREHDFLQMLILVLVLSLLCLPFSTNVQQFASTLTTRKYALTERRKPRYCAVIVFFFNNVQYETQHWSLTNINIHGKKKFKTKGFPFFLSVVTVSLDVDMVARGGINTHCLDLGRHKH